MKIRENFVSKDNIFVVDTHPGHRDIMITVGEIGDTWRWSINTFMGTIYVSPEMFDSKIAAVDRARQFQGKVSCARFEGVDQVEISAYRPDGPALDTEKVIAVAAERIQAAADDIGYMIPIAEATTFARLTIRAEEEEMVRIGIMDASALDHSAADFNHANPGKPQ